MNSYSAVLRTPGVQPFLWTQFLNAFNDNVYKIVVSLLAVEAAANTASTGAYLSLAGFIFVAPFLLFSSYAGQLADRFPKRQVLIVTKAFEIVAMLCALFALVNANTAWMMGVLFLTATQAALFSPAKYGIVPELVVETDLARANGLLEMSTFLAIILGTIGGSWLVAQWKHQPALIGSVLVAVAVAGTVLSFRVTGLAAADGRRRFSWNPCSDLAAGFAAIRRDQAVFRAVLGTTYFWFLGAVFQMVILLFGKETLGAGETVTGLLVASLAIGIGVGSITAGRLSGSGIEPGLVPLGALGMAFTSLLLALAGRNLPFAFTLLAATGVMGGLFVVPLNAILQHRPAAYEKGRVLATANFVNTIGVMAASGVVWLLHERLHLSAATVIGVCAGLTLLAALYSLTLVPNFALRFTVWLLARVCYRIRVLGRENLPLQGPALLVSNHVTFIDGFLISSCVQRFIRFLVDENWYDRFARAFFLIRAIRVPAGNRRAIVQAIQMARHELQQGHVVCIFAEGALSRTGKLGEFHRGLEKIVDGLPVPVIPVHLNGLWGSIFSVCPGANWRRSLRSLPLPVTVSFGAPLQQPSADAVRDAVIELGASSAGAAIVGDHSLGRLFVESAKRNWRGRAMCDSTGRSLTYGKSLTAALLFRDRLMRMHPDESMLGVALPASVAASLVNIGITLAGRIPVNLNFTSGRAAVDSAIAQCQLKTVVTSRQFVAKSQFECRAQLIFVEDLLSFSGGQKAIAWLKAKLLPVRALTPRGIAAPDLATVLFSSGSTGEPKGVMLSHRSLIANVQSVHQLFPVGRQDTIAGVLPLFHSFGFTFTLWFPLLHGASAAYHPQPLDGKGVGEMIQRSRATFLPASPSFCQAYLRSCTCTQFASLRHVLVGAERLSPALAAAFSDKFGIALLEGYGATEMSPVISVNVPDAGDGLYRQKGARNGTVGQPIPGVAVRVVHQETGEHLPAGQEGLLLVTGPNRMLGYLDRPLETEASLRDGWYVTGDIVTIDSEGFIRIVDRQSRFSKIGGEMVPHARIEESLHQAFQNIKAAVTAIPDERRGERLVLFVADACGITAHQLRQALLDAGLPNLWIPKIDDFRFVENLPVLATGKLDLRALKELADRHETTGAVA